MNRKRLTDARDLIIFSRKMIRIGEMYFREDVPMPSSLRVDLIRCVAILDSDDHKVISGSSTLIIDLGELENVLLSNMDAGTRYGIRRALKDSLIHSMNDNPSQVEIDRFCDYYDSFAKTKSLRPVFRQRLYSLASSRMLMLSSMGSADGDVLVQHAHLFTRERSMLLYSASLYRENADPATRSLVGRANRLLHWYDILAARDLGIPLYDFSGVDVTDKSPETTRIAKFKLGFGGVVVPSHVITRPASLKGLIVQSILKVLGSSF